MYARLIRLTASVFTCTDLNPMVSMGKYVFLIVWVLLLPAFVCGQLSTAEKQALLELHNELRGSAGGANLVQSVSTFTAFEHELRTFILILCVFCRHGARN